MYLVDKISEARRGTAEAVAWMRSANPQAIHPSTLTLSEIRRGIALKQKSDPTTAVHLAEWLRHQHADPILPITDEISVEWGKIAAIRPRGDVDGLIAAMAIVHDLVVMTGNVADFDDTGADVINPWAFG